MMSFGFAGFSEGALVAIPAGAPPVPFALAPASGGTYGALMCGGSGMGGGGVAAAVTVVSAPASGAMYGALMWGGSLCC